MFFASDNGGPTHPQILEAVTKANEGYRSGYGADAEMDRVREMIRDVFEAPDAAVYLVATGTVANSLALATLCQPWDTIFCTPLAHIEEDECNAPEFYTGGAKLTLVGEADKMTPEQLRATIKSKGGSVHNPQRGPVSITQVTELGHVYSLAEIEALCSVAKEFDLPVHLDGARFANALVALGCTPAEMTWKAGVDAVSFGGTKNGCMGVEAVIFFDPKHAREFELRRKRAGHLFSKHRYLSAQMLGYLTGDLWLQTARQANDNCDRLAAGMRELPGVEFIAEPQANMIFAKMPRALHQRVFDAGAYYYLMDGDLEGDDPNEPLLGRFVCDWSIGAEGVDQFLAAAKG
ncbi:threonine aldolase family protein [Thalassovita aquimarina]|uniref:L-threonine aldolase n=1 Tax=Thalassovita aquimarina TaxID=2785917 RepID=A0ABS5HW22_9RHOB|nr:low specificity L-threonine aldolase [Thalassovita aquimarina]MBR9653181.1 low specificity L-threonine aldolase [Thalassovita aquimarina]